MVDCDPGVFLEYTTFMDYSNNLFFIAVKC